MHYYHCSPMNSLSSEGTTVFILRVYIEHSLFQRGSWIIWSSVRMTLTYIDIYSNLGHLYKSIYSKFTLHIFFLQLEGCN
jgi:hypothetical protein